MTEITSNRGRRSIGRVVGTVAAALLFTATIAEPQVANAGHGGGGGGFHGGGGGFHDGFGRGGFGFGFGGIYAPYWGYGYPYYDYGYYPDYGNYGGYGYGYSQPYGSGQTWYYCSDPAGYYPYVTQCNTGWQAVPAS